MSSVIKISDIDCLKSNKLVLIDDEMNKVCLGIKTNKCYSKVDFKSMLTFIFAVLYGSFPKAVYIPFILLFLFVPKEKFKSKKFCTL